MPRLRVLQFNMQFGQRWDEADPDRAPVDLALTIAEIRRHSADVIFLQEVEHAKENGVQSYPPENYTRMREALDGYDGVFGYPAADPRELPFGIGLAIFSRTPLREVFQEVLPSPAVPFEFNGRTLTPTDRLLLGARTTVAGVELTLLNVHLLAFFMLHASSGQHREQRDRVEGRLREANGPTILAGDFNVSGHESLVEQFGAVGFASAQTREITWRRRPYVLDHVFYNAPLRRKSTAVVPTPASDHHVLVVDFELP